MSKASTHNITKQIEVERMAREAEKVMGITNALDHAIMNATDTELVQEFGGAFTAAEDIARNLSRDLIRMADEIAAEKWAEETEDDNR